MHTPTSSGWTPKICTSIFADRPAVLRKRLAEAVKGGSDYVEVRLDYFRKVDLQELKDACGEHLERCILTCRPLWEGGRFSGAESRRLGILTNAASLKPAYIDIELRAIRNATHIPDGLRRTNQELIVSWHDVNSTPRTSILKRVMKEAETYLNTVKIVTNANRVEDNFTVLSLYPNASNRLIAFCMGEKGITSRVLCPFLGSPFTYASLGGMKTAQGQLALSILKKFYEGIRRP